MALAAPAASNAPLLRLEREFKAPPERVYAACDVFAKSGS